MGSNLDTAIQKWTLQVMAASGHLVGLYRSMRDDRQTSLALRARGPCEERCDRLRLGGMLSELAKALVAGLSEESEIEERAWRWIVEGQAGLLSFHLLADRGGEPGEAKARSLRGSYTQTRKALGLGLKGFRIAFPEEVAKVGILEGLQSAASQVVSAFLLDAAGLLEGGEAAFRSQIHEEILGALLAEQEVARA